jgi:hypothetical protein
MGHQRVGTLPDTEPWRRVVGLIADAADVREVAAATTQAALKGLEKAYNDEGIAYSLFLLGRIALAARGGDFADGLRELGLVVPDCPDVFDLVAAFADAVDRRLQRSRRRTDLGEMAELAAVETLAALLGRRSASLFGATPAEVRQAARELSTDRGFATLAHDYFARFTHRFLGYHLGRELPLHVGGNGRFADPEEHNAFVDRLEVHCREAAAIMREFARAWYSKANSPAGKGVTPATARGFLNHVIEKLRRELTARGAKDG